MGGGLTVVAIVVVGGFCTFTDAVVDAFAVALDSGALVVAVGASAEGWMLSEGICGG